MSVLGVRAPAVFSPPLVFRALEIPVQLGLDNPLPGPAHGLDPAFPEPVELQLLDKRLVCSPPPPDYLVAYVSEYSVVELELEHFLQTFAQRVESLMGLDDLRLQRERSHLRRLEHNVKTVEELPSLAEYASLAIESIIGAAAGYRCQNKELYGIDLVLERELRGLPHGFRVVFV